MRTSSLSSTDSHRVAPTRRGFLKVAAGGLALLYGPRARAEITGQAVPKLNAFDDMMVTFLKEHQPPGASLAIACHGRLVYARGFGFANAESREKIRPQSLFRIASISKPFTAAAVMTLIEKGKLKLDDKVFPILKLEPQLEAGGKIDPRWHDITVRHCLQHTGGWDRGKSFDPMGAHAAEDAAAALKVQLPIDAKQIIRFAMGKPLDSDPGTAYAYSNFGYCVLGRVIEAASGKAYSDHVSTAVLAPLGIRDMRLGKNLFEDRASNEVKYYDRSRRTGRAISGPQIGARVPLPYGVECIETMDANGGWIASASDLMRFAVALDDPKKCPILNEASMQTLLAPPPGAVGHGPNGNPKTAYYACGWNVRSSEGPSGRCAKSHSGLLAGSSTMLVCGADGINWAALFNCDADKRGAQFAASIQPLMRKAIQDIKDWPEENLFQS